MNPDLMIIARGENPRTESKLVSSGANKVILPTAIGASKVAQLIIRPSAENMLEQITSQNGMKDDLNQIGLEFDEIPIDATSALAERTLGDIEVRSNHGFLVVGIRQSDGNTILNPPTDTKLAAGDVVIVLGHENDTAQLAERYASGRNKMTYRGVTIEA